MKKTAKGPRIQLLFFKEHFVGRTHPGRAAMEKFSAKLRTLGLDQTTIGLGPDKLSFLAALSAAGLNKKSQRRFRSCSQAHQQLS